MGLRKVSNSNVTRQFDKSDRSGHADLTENEYGIGLEEEGITKVYKEALRMRRTNDFITALALSGDIMNTLGGGMSEPRVAFESSDVGQMLRIEVPGVDVSKLNIEINFNRLTVFQGASQSPEVTIPVPRIIFDKPIPYFIDVDKISAMAEGKVLFISLPFNEKANGYHRKVGIKT